MDTDDPRLANVLDRLDDTVLDPAAWAPALDALSDLVGASGSALLSHSCKLGVWSDRVDPGAKRLFYDRFVDNPIQQGMDQVRTQVQGRMPPVFTDRQLMPRSAFTRTAFFNDFMRPHGAHAYLVVDLSNREGTAALNLSCSRPKEGFDRRDIDLMTSLRSRIARAFWLGRRLESERRLNEGLRDFLDRSRHGIILVSGDGRVHHLNDAAKAFLTGPAGLTVRNGWLRSTRQELGQRLEALIEAATRSGGSRRSGALFAASAGRRLPLSIAVTPVGPESSMGAQGCCAIVSIVDPENDTPPSLKALREVFGLTFTEAQVALALLGGRTPREVAAELNISFYTVRAHLVRIFRKTDTSRQPELVALLARVTRTAPV